MVAYYTIILFHWHYLLSYLTQHSLFSSGIIYISLLLPMILMKGGFIFYDRKKPKAESFKTVAAISFYILLTLSLGLFVVLAAKWLRQLLTTPYWHNAHLFWVAISLFLVLGYGYLLLYKFRLISWELLVDLKAVPIVSPIFCFGGPKLWADNLPFLAQNRELQSIYTVTSITAGVLFLIYLILFAIFNNRYTATKKKSESLVDINQQALSIETKPSTPPLYVCLSILGLAFFLFLLTVFDILLFLIS